ncbi:MULTISPECIES: hypothetical protein [Francisella]|uniref:Domain amino terminal to FKBP-type peptidyl-prolyl isomerase n=1 Tax=Francisella opportunistica TaxID=2016517 RepID=A0A345JR40_9GAMM|nr:MULTISPECIES: hypothetical protein [Francisella]APC91505.1 hypothetical protein BBG19_0769 [Francisella sp. MA067296]AXH29786.1 hypothetical protein CGC43_03915 [Francisella opportunistica]AXH31436.1 hypothetical protein CGC44_03880 [Francisella opportunistica]AXH33082.1 hypothetical protein CGC45_03900 [Francisella opportunistica]
MKNINNFTLLLAALIFSVEAFAAQQPYNAYTIGQALGKASHKSFAAMDQELVKKDFILGFDDTLLEHKPDIDKISDKDSYEIGMIIAAQYKVRLKKMVAVDKTNCQEFVKGFNNSVDAKDTNLTAQDKQILKHFKISRDGEDN